MSTITSHCCQHVILQLGRYPGACHVLPAAAPAESHTQVQGLVPAPALQRLQGTHDPHLPEAPISEQQ
jgi:hypothetical protein